MKIVLVCMTHKPSSDFEKWINHYFNLGINEIYLRVEDTPEFNLNIDNVFIEHANLVDRNNNWYSIQERQEKFVNNIINKMKYGTWVLHVDDDELLQTYKNCKISEILSTIPAYFETLYIKTVEAVFPKMYTGKNCFQETDKFMDCNSGQYCTSYIGGKSIVKVGKGIRAFGPHMFRGIDWIGKDTYKCLKVDTSNMRICHYESSTFDRWYMKFSNMIGKIPKSSYYNDSADAVRKMTYN